MNASRNGSAAHLGLARLRDEAMYYTIRAAIASMGSFSVDYNLRMLRTLGSAFGRAPFNRGRFQRAIDNLTWCFPEWDEASIRRCASDAYGHLLSLAAEMVFTSRLITEDGWVSRIRLGDLRYTLGRMLSGKPAILITGHCGNWETLGYTLAVLGFPLHALYRPLDLKPLDKWVRETRGRRGMTLVDKFGAAAEAPKILERGGMIGFIADQNAGDRGMFSPYFGRMASTYKSIGLLAIRYKAPIVCGQARRLHASAHHDEKTALGTQSFQHEIDVVDVIDPSDWESQPDPLFYVTARYRRAIETMVRRAPEQYLWMHRYWKTRPHYEREGKPIPERVREKLRALPWMTDDEFGRIIERSERDAREAVGAAPMPAPAPAGD